MTSASKTPSWRPSCSTPSGSDTGSSLALCPPFESGYIKAIKATQPGGLIALINSRFTLDSESATSRLALWRCGTKLITVVRLPSDTHRRIAGTNIVTDVLLIQTRERSYSPKCAESLYKRTARSNRT